MESSPNVQAPSGTLDHPSGIEGQSIHGTTDVLRWFRIWMVVLSSASVDLMGVYYGMAATNPPFFDSSQEQQGQEQEQPPYRLLWQDWCLIILNILIYVAYAYSLRGRTRIKNKHLRASLMSLLAILLIVLSVDLVVLLCLHTNPNGRVKMFECHAEDPVCYLRWSSILVNMIKACFVIVEVYLTWRGC